VQRANRLAIGHPKVFRKSKEPVVFDYE